MQNSYQYEQYENNLIGAAVLGAASAVPKVAQIVNKVGGAVTKVASKVGIGGVTQDRFIDRTKEAFDIFDKAGYTGAFRGQDKIAYQDYKLGKSQVDDRKSNGNYEKEFGRLHSYIVDRMNLYNPGLGNEWAKYFPAFEMANLGNITSKGAWEAFKEFVKAFPPGSYDPTQAYVTSGIADATKLPNDHPDKVVDKSLIDAAKAVDTIVDKITGKTYAINTAGERLYEVNQPNKMAGFSMPTNMTVVMMVIAVVILYFLFR